MEWLKPRSGRMPSHAEAGASLTKLDFGIGARTTGLASEVWGGCKACAEAARAGRLALDRQRVYVPFQEVPPYLRTSDSSGSLPGA